ncbi:MAG: hypothetical protein JWO82_1858, partial [Akkermansiaceae bacterium]|nr:hypothetical protein [Akkermansiaceae bacterium]
SPSSPLSGNVTVTVYDKAGNLLTSGVVNNISDSQENGFFGVVATNGEQIGRINVYSGANAFAGADNITVYSVPEASALSLAGLAALGLLRRRRH